MSQPRPAPLTPLLRPSQIPGRGDRRGSKGRRHRSCRQGGRRTCGRRCPRWAWRRGPGPLPVSFGFGLGVGCVWSRLVSFRRGFSSVVCQSTARPSSVLAFAATLMASFLRCCAHRFPSPSLSPTPCTQPPRDRPRLQAAGSRPASVRSSPSGWRGQWIRCHRWRWQQATGHASRVPAAAVLNGRLARRWGTAANTTRHA